MRSITNMTDSFIRVMTSPRDRRRGWLIAGGLHAPCALGRGGVSRGKREGDGATPAGDFALRRLWLRPGSGFAIPRGFPSRRIRPDDGWCDDPGHRRYNRPVRLPFPASCERMWREDALYDAVIEIGWNDRPAIRGRGSAIFLHLARPSPTGRGFAPTEGCVAIARRDMARLLRIITRGSRLRIG